MNNVFSIKRVGLLLRKHWMERRKPYLAGLGGYTILMLVIYLVAISPYQSELGMSTSLDQRFRNNQMSIYFMGLFIGGIIYSALMFTDYSRKETGVFNLLLPASHLEKALVILCYGVFFYLIAFTCCFMLVDSIGVLYHRQKYDVSLLNLFHSGPEDYFNIFSTYVVFLFTQTLFILGSIYFRKLGFFKTALVAIILYFLSTYFFKSEEIGEHNVDYSFTEVSTSLSNYQSSDFFAEHTKLSSELSPGVTFLFYSLVVVFFLTLCSSVYLRLKEKEI